MAKESEDKELSKDTYILQEVTTQTKIMPVNIKENKIITDEDFKIEVLNKLDKILKSVG